MKDETKEILGYFRKYMNIDDCIKLSKIEDCITNLQEKNERLNNVINELENGLKEEIDRLEKVALENKNNKFEFDKLVLIRGKVMDIYEELKELKEGK